LGRPGTAKTRLADLLGIVEHGPDFYRRFDAPKENIVTIAGLPDVKAMGDGKFAFVHTTPDGSPTGFIWDKKHITINELTRISAEAANYLLEPLQEGTFFGQDLPIKTRYDDPSKIDYSIIATENPEGHGVRRIDEALFDRFRMAVAVPDGQEVIGRDNRRMIIMSNVQRYAKPDGLDSVLSAFAQSIRNQFSDLLHNTGILFPISEWATTIWETFFDSMRNKPKDVQGPDGKLPYVSHRRQAMSLDAALGFVAYQYVVGDTIDLVKACEQSLIYTIALPLKFSEGQTQFLLQAHNQAKIHLVNENITPKAKFEAELQLRSQVKEKIAYIAANKSHFLSVVPVDEREIILGSHILGKATPFEKISVHDLFVSLGGHEELLRKCQLQIIGSVSTAVAQLHRSINDREVMSFSEYGIFDDWERLSNILSTRRLSLSMIKQLLEPSGDDLGLKISRLIQAA
jgi:MoxR-like ATPase